MADEVEGTVAPQTFPIPQFIKDSESPLGTKQFLHLMPSFKKGDTSPAPASYEKVEIFNFTFLGQPFDSGTYNQYDRNPTDPAKQVVGPPLTVTGVNAELRAFLIAAQRDIFQGYAARQASRGEPVTKDGFKAYCGVIGSHKTFQPRDGKHRRGSAIDIDPTFNPYTVTGQNAQSPPFSGEMPGNFRTGGDTPPNRATLNGLRQAAMDAYERALQFTFGSKAMDMKFRDPNAKRDPSEDTFERYDRVSRAMRVYMTCGFVPTKTNKIPQNANAQTRSLQDIRDTILNLAEDSHFEGGDTPFKATDNAFLQAFQSQVAADFAAMRKVCIYDSWTLDKGVQTFGQSRDPCYGFLTLRRHVVKCLLDVQINNRRLRWGALHFGADQSGDMMHFDIGSLSDSLQSTTEPNPNGIFFGP